MEMVSQGEVWVAQLPQPRGSEPGFKRPVIVVQGDNYNRSKKWGTVIVLPLTSNLDREGIPGNVLLSPKATGLEKSSVVMVAQPYTLDRGYLDKRVGKLSKAKLALVLAGMRLVLEV
jgi:mRNA interferase MazF